VTPSLAATPQPGAGAAGDESLEDAPPWDPSSSPNSVATLSNSEERRVFRAQNLRELARMDELHASVTLPPSPVSGLGFGRHFS